MSYTINLSDEQLLEALKDERGKFTQSDDEVMNNFIVELQHRGVYPQETVPGNPNSVKTMVDGYGAYWYKWDPDPDSCPSCGENMNDEKTGPPFSRRMGIYDRGQDRTVAWRCPFCKHEWER